MAKNRNVYNSQQYMKRKRLSIRAYHRQQRQIRRINRSLEAIHMAMIYADESYLHHC